MELMLAFRREGWSTAAAAPGSCTLCAATDFGDVPSVANGSCTACSGTTPAECSEAMCAMGFHSYDGGECTRCDGACAGEERVEGRLEIAAVDEAAWQSD